MAELIKKEDYVPELEERVKRYMDVIPPQPVNKILHKRVVIPPRFASDQEKEEWEFEEIRRIREGHNGMCPKMYFWFNYCFIKNIKGGKIEPEYRVADNEWFNAITEAEESEGWGLVCVKRRRAGFSWKAACDCAHDAITKNFSNIGLNSKTERDSVILFDKVKFILDNLPDFLRPSVGRRSGMKMAFFAKIKDDHGNDKIVGTESEINVVAPTDTAFEGQMLNKWIADEAGKTPNLPQMWSYTVDCLMQETVRVGVPILFGTSGEVGKEGRGLVQMWRDSDVHRLTRFFFAGYMGLYVDKYGNDRIEECVRYIVYERDRLKSLSAKEYNDFLQRYPLTPDEAFMQASTGGIGNPALINQQMQDLRECPPKNVRGRFSERHDKVVFIPDQKGPVIMWEKPNDDLKYIAGCDPADHDDVNSEASDMSMYIMSKRDGLRPPRPVLEITYRPQKAREYYKQALWALMYFNNCKILIENNRYRMITEFEDFGAKHLLLGTPKLTSLVSKGRSTTLGIRMSDDVKDNALVPFIESYIDDNVEQIPSTDLLQEFFDFGSRNTDRAMAFGICLIALKSTGGNREHKKKKKDMFKNMTYKVNVQGNITRR